jgi:heat shock protein HslJ
MTRNTVILAMAVSMACCTQPPAEPPAQNVTQSSADITERDWVLVALGNFAAPFGTQQKSPTLRLTSAQLRAAGYAGCNQYFARYSLRGDSLKFESPGATKMYCASSAELENAFLRMLPEVLTYKLRDTVLTLSSRSGVVARFHASR